MLKPRSLTASPSALKLTLILAMLSSTLGCSTPEVIEPEPINEEEQAEKMDAIIAEAEEMLEAYEAGALERKDAIAKFQTLCDRAGAVLQTGKEATEMRISHSGLVFLSSAEVLRDRVSALLYNEGDPKRAGIFEENEPAMP